MKMKRCIVPSILLMLSLEAALLVAGGRPSVPADDAGAILLPSQGKEAVMAAVRPWKCCDRAVCTRSIPPICTCLDEVFVCPSTCKVCGPSMDNPSRQVCQDQYVGDPGPICRPWQCCDAPICTRSNPPTCQCVDKVKQCAPTCKSCEPLTSDPSLRVCNDRYFGPFPPACTPPEAVAAGGRPSVAPLAHDVGRPSAAPLAHDVAAILLPSEGKGQAGMVASRPWKCCNLAICTRSIPPICRCADEVDHCASTCHACVQSPANPSRHVCQDLHTGDPGPECTDDGGLSNGVAKAEPASHDHDHQVTAAAAKKKGGEEERPWKCCDFGLCTMSYPPTCRCDDQVEHCAATCKNCVPSTSDSSLRVCTDWYHGFPGPKCSEVGAGGN